MGRQRIEGAISIGFTPHLEPSKEVLRVGCDNLESCLSNVTDSVSEIMTGLEVLPRNNLRRNLALQYQAETEEKQYHKFAQRFMRTMGPTSGDPEKKYGIKRHRNLGATVFEGSRDPADSESWLHCNTVLGAIALHKNGALKSMASSHDTAALQKNAYWIVY
ncbi:uncharacterized protein E5676_scaffold2612G00090 [Cucumis melo var. makuwa]|uniref:Uncharacterized protein n=1 Tax=Cucumis melo var. makuwa TaxID=1194695 RepID=A0A5A7T7M3_CUCMM|nr:uncharacterized protein E6C27_scaffold1170G00200 [Cucumis melo var. makuwa]TYJ96005.1 uncharacterized protein E5676_scaffold2612G00090 [Cucumis melo var. makuwa]